MKQAILAVSLATLIGCAPSKVEFNQVNSAMQTKATWELGQKRDRYDVPIVGTNESLNHEVTSDPQIVRQLKAIKVATIVTAVFAVLIWGAEAAENSRECSDREHANSPVQCGD